MIIYMKGFFRKIKYWFQRRTRGWSDDECWNLDLTFLQWINSRFKKYREQAGEIVDLSYFKFKYKGKTYTQLELIDKVIELSDMILENYDSFERGYTKELHEIFKIFELIYWNMWW